MHFLANSLQPLLQLSHQNRDNFITQKSLLNETPIGMISDTVLVLKKV